MIKLNHLTIPVAQHSRSREWYTRNLGLKVEFEIPDKLFWGYGAELRDPDGYLIYLWDERTMRGKF
jgi:catechol 2,3-dioxygenase-like lactoylglutathione lyase family enzyme